MRPNPDRNYQAALAAVQATGAAPADPRSAALVVVLSGGVSPLDEVAYAYDLFNEEEHRAIIDAFLLTKCPISEVCSLLEIEQLVIETYSYLFMDMTVFRNRLEIISFASHYESNAYGKEIVKTAVSVGSDYLHWAYGKPKDDYDPRAIIKHTMVDSFFRGMAHKGNGLTTGVAKEAHKWWGSAVKNAELSERLSPSTAKLAAEELRIALGQNDETLTSEQFEVPLDQILH